MVTISPAQMPRMKRLTKSIICFLQSQKLKDTSFVMAVLRGSLNALGVEGGGSIPLFVSLNFGGREAILSSTSV
jgi:hypothetical protein